MKYGKLVMSALIEMSFFSSLYAYSDLAPMPPAFDLRAAKMVAEHEFVEWENTLNKNTQGLLDQFLITLKSGNIDNILDDAVQIAKQKGISPSELTALLDSNLRESWVFGFYEGFLGTSYQFEYLRQIHQRELPAGKERDLLLFSEKAMNLMLPVISKTQNQDIPEWMVNQWQVTNIRRPFSFYLELAGINHQEANHLVERFLKENPEKASEINSKRLHLKINLSDEFIIFLNNQASPIGKIYFHIHYPEVIKIHIHDIETLIKDTDNLNHPLRIKLLSEYLFYLNRNNQFNDSVFDAVLSYLGHNLANDHRISRILYQTHQFFSDKVKSRLINQFGNYISSNREQLQTRYPMFYDDLLWILRVIKE